MPDRESLSLLVEGTSDELTLGSAPVPAAVFSEVLAEAQAAVNGADVGAHPQWPPAQNVLTVLAGPERIEGLNESLASIGVPLPYPPKESEATLDGLARVLATLPAAPTAPIDGGSVLVVVGARRDAQAAAQVLVAQLGLAPSDLLTVDRTDAGRQKVVRRRSSNKVTVVVVEASLRSRDLAVAASWIEHVSPDYVLGAVAATAKRADVEHWRARVGRLDALALSRLGYTASPGELMGLLPIALLDGEDRPPPCVGSSRCSGPRWRASNEAARLPHAGGGRPSIPPGRRHRADRLRSCPHPGPNGDAESVPPHRPGPSRSQSGRGRRPGLGRVRRGAPLRTNSGGISEGR